MTEYSDNESVSSDESDSDSDGEQIQAVLKKVPKAAVPEVKQKRVYVRKEPLDEVKKTVIVDKLAKARLAKATKATAKKQAEEQEKVELAELKKLKDKGQLKVKKERPAEISIPKKKKEKIVEVHHHHYGEADDEPKKARVKKTEVLPQPPPPRAPVRPAVPKMVFA
jgi:hypothetical protein